MEAEGLPRAATGLARPSQGPRTSAYADGGVRFPSGQENAQAIQDEDWEVHTRDHCGSQYVLRESNPIRRIWTVIVGLLLLYTGTLYLYRLSFVELHMGEPIRSDSSWSAFDEVVNVLFVVDLVINFVFTYKDARGIEVDSIRLVVRNYLLSTFVINLVACMPSSLIELMTKSEGGSQVNINRAARVARLQRVLRLGRLFKFAMQVNIAAWRWLQKLRGVRIINFFVGLIFVVHVLACGYYLVAACHPDPEDTWVARHTIDLEGNVAVLALEPHEQWMHAMYFILTVFTTVGFGDMSARTPVEMVYVGFVMVFGVIVHSIIISEVINLIRHVDQAEGFVKQQEGLVEAFAQHTDLDEESTQKLKDWVIANARGWMNRQYDIEEMRGLIADKCMPRSLLGRLPGAMFSGRLVRSGYLKLAGSKEKLPVRLPLLLALSVYRAQYEAGEHVYEMNDFAFSIFLVTSGTFAHVALPTASGGIDAMPSMPPQEERTSTPGPRTYISRNIQTRLHQAARGHGYHSQGAATTPDNSGRLGSKAGYPQLYPYQLFSANSYFGDIELLRGHQRYATVRCESAEGTVLVLQKNDLQNLEEEFPQYGAAWRSAGVRREMLRRNLLGKFTRGLTHRHLAAVTVQKYLRRWRVEQASPRAAAEEPVAPGHLRKSQSRLRLLETCERSKRVTMTTSLNCKHCEDLRSGFDALRAEVEALRYAVLGKAPPASTPASAAGPLSATGNHVRARSADSGSDSSVAHV